jgi:hypothetical protein
MKIQKVFLSPENAARLLVNNTNNRNLSAGRVARYTNDIVNNRWVEDTGELIKIGTDGCIIDGQHRLTAVVKANKGINIHIATHVSKDVFDVIDSGKSRSSSDVLKIAGVINATKTAAFIQSYNQFANTKYRYHQAQLESSMTSKMILKYYNENSFFVDEVIKHSSTFYNQFQKVWSHGDVSLFYGLFTTVDKRLGHEFIRQLCQGTDITNDTIILLRNRLIADKVNATNKLLVTHRRALVIKAWNCFYLGKSLKWLKFSSEIEDFPKIVGLEK